MSIVTPSAAAGLKAREALESLKHLAQRIQDFHEAGSALTDHMVRDLTGIAGRHVQDSHSINPFGIGGHLGQLGSILGHAVIAIVERELAFKEIVPAISTSEIHAFQRPDGFGAWREVEIDPFYEFLIARHGNGVAMTKALTDSASKLVSAFSLLERPPVRKQRGVELTFNYSRDEYALKQGKVDLTHHCAQYLLDVFKAMSVWAKWISPSDAALVTSFGDLAALQYLDVVHIEPSRVTSRCAGDFGNVLFVEGRCRLNIYIPDALADKLKEFVSEFSWQVNERDSAA